MTTPSNLPISRTLNEAEAAAYIGLSRSFLAKSRMQGHLKNRTLAPPFIKIGHRVRYRRDDLDNWLESQPRFLHLGALA